MDILDKILKGGDLRSIGQSNKVVSLIDNQESFDKLFYLMLHHDRKVVMRAADAIEKITFNNPDYLKQHTNEIIHLCNNAKEIELKWHLALIVSRLWLDIEDFGSIWQTLTNWAADRKESKIVRVNSVQGLFNLLKQHNELKQDFMLTLNELEKENVPSINARIRKLKTAATKIAKAEIGRQIWIN